MRDSEILYRRWRLSVEDRSMPDDLAFLRAVLASPDDDSLRLVYADGAINCWGFVDVPLFRGKLAEGWVVPRAEVGGILSIHNLGQARVDAAQWDLTPDDIERQVMDALRELNPTLEGLLDMHGT